MEKKGANNRFQANKITVQDLVVRFIVGGGVVVAVFALIGSCLKPRSFAGLFGAAPSVALATLGLSVAEHGRPYSATEARSMVLGAVALCIYTACVSQLLARSQWPALPVSALSIFLWLSVAGSVWYAWLR
jgi:hypothetical protein